MTAPAASPTQAVALYLRLWTQAEASDPGVRPAWTDDSPFTRMLRQVVRLGGGVPEEAQSTGLPSARFADEFRAARAARQIQALVTGFAGAAEEGVLAASVAILPASLSRNEGDAAALCAYLAQRGQPAQIVFATRGEERSSPVPGLSTRLLEEHGGDGLWFHELLWKHREEAVAAAVRAHARAAKRRTAVPAAPVPVPPESARPTLAERGMDLREDMGSKARSLREGVAGSMSHASAWSRSLTLQAIGGGRRFLAGAAGMCVVLAAGFLLTHRSKPAAVRPVPSPAAVKTAPAAPPPVSSAAPAQSATVQEKSAPRKPEPPKKMAANEEPERPARGRGTLSPEQTRQVLSRGQAELDRGCYTKAIGYYRRVLDDDPRNGSASGGMEKARTRMRLSGGDANAACQ